MTGRRLLYAACLAAAALFYLFDTGYFSLLLLTVGVGFLPLQLLLSLPGLLGARVRLAAGPAEAVGGQPFAVALTGSAWRPWCAMRVTLVCENLFAQSRVKRRLTLAEGRPLVLDADQYGAPCGALRFSLKRPRVLDLAGILAFPLHCPTPVMVLARPEIPVPPPPLPDAALDQSALPQAAAGRPGPGAMREYTDIREYRAGDSPRDIHWKLTAKFDKLMVREGSFSQVASPQLCFDFFGEPEAVAGTLGRLEALSGELWAIERLHRLHWRAPGGEPASRCVMNKAEFDTVLWELLETPLPKTGRPMEECLPVQAGPVLLISPAETLLF